MKKTVKKHVAEAALVSFTFASVLPGGAAFAAADVTDVNGHWAEQAIHDWMERGYIGGYEDNTFRPDQTITRAEFVKLVNKTIDADQTATIAFSDVSGSDWFAGEVALALGEGYVSGFEDGTFRPGQPVTRAQAAAFLAKALKLTGDADAVADMTDSAAIPDWAAGAIGAVVAQGYMGGYEDGTFRPNRPLTRAEAVSMLNRVLNDDGNEDTKPPVVIGGGGGSSSGGSSGGGGSVTRYTVTFDYQYDDKVEKETVKKGSKLDKPEDPTRTGYIFGGWYTDKDCTTPWDFANDTVREATTLYAKWEVASVSSVEVVDGTDGYTPVTSPVAGQVLKANVTCSDGTEIGTYPADDRVTYKWYYKESPETVLGTDSAYTVTRDNVGKTLCVTVTVKGYEGEVTWTAAAAVPVVTVSSVAVVDGVDGFTPVTNPRAGQVLYANVTLSDGTEIGVHPVNADVTYKWYYEGSDAVLGTDPIYTVTTDNAGKTLCVTVTVKDCEGEATWTAAKAVAAVSSVKVVDGKDGVTEVTNPVAGQVLSANVMLSDGTEIGTYPVNTDVEYVWSYEGSDAVLGTDPIYTVTKDNVGKTLCLKVTMKGYEGEATWTADKAAVMEVSSVAVVDGTDGFTPVTNPRAGQVLYANVTLSDGTEIGVHPVNADVTYKWYYEGSDAVLGTEPIYTVTTDNAGKTLCVTVTVKDCEGEATWTAAKAVAAVSSVKVVDGKDGVTEVTNPVAGQVLSANVMLSDGTEIGTYPVNTDVEYVWSYEGSDAVLGTDPIYTVTKDNVGKTLCLKVTMKGYEGEATWTADKAAVMEVSSVAVVDGTDGFTPVTNPRAGQVLYANVTLSDGTEIGVYPVNADVTYKWYYEGSDAVLGTDPIYTVTTDNAGKTLCVTVTVKDCEGEATWTAAKAVAAVSSVKVVDGKDGVTEVTNPVAGQVLSANVMLSDGTEIGTYPVNTDVEYVWSYEGSDAVLGTDPIYTVTKDNVGKTLCLKVTMKGYEGEATWTADKAAVMEVSSVAVVDGTDGFTPVTNPRAGQVLYANVTLSDGTEIGVYPVNADVTYKWYYEGSDAVLGTDPIYTVTTDNAGKTLCVTVTVKDCEGEAIWTADAAIVQ